MIPPRSFSVFAVIFAVVYAVVYVIAVENNYALFTYHAAIGEFDAGVQAPKDGPAMYWYGWMATSGIVAALAGVIAWWLPTQITRHLWSGWAWAAPLAVLGAFAWMLRNYFL
jgi:hypothetical protein